MSTRPPGVVAFQFVELELESAVGMALAVTQRLICGKRRHAILIPTRSDLLDDASKRANRSLESLDTRSVAPAKEAVAALAGFDQAFPEHTSTAEAVLAELDEIGSPATMASAGGRFFGFVIGGALPVTVAANWLAAAWDQNAGLVVTSPINAHLENIALRWVKEIFHLPMQSD